MLFQTKKFLKRFAGPQAQNQTLQNASKKIFHTAKKQNKQRFFNIFDQSKWL